MTGIDIGKESGGQGREFSDVMGSPARNGGWFGEWERGVNHGGTETRRKTR
jgi:hypothetical protein